MAAFGASDAWQGGGMVVDAVQGISSEGFNLIKGGFQSAWPEWGGALYEGASLGFNSGALSAKVPLMVGASDGIERTSSLFGVATTRWNNATEKFGVFLSKSVNQMILTGSAIGKTFGFGLEVNKAAGSGPRTRWTGLEPFGATSRLLLRLSALVSHGVRWLHLLVASCSTSKRCRRCCLLGCLWDCSLLR
jgi:hypothetical protein